MQRIRRWHGQSLRRQLLVPIIAGGTSLAAVSVFAIQTQARYRLEADLERRGVLVANAVSYAAQSAEHLHGLERFVLQLGAEHDVLEITVVAGSPVRVLASTRSAFVGKMLTQLPGEEVGDDLAKAIALNGSHHHFNALLQLYDYSTPVLIHDAAVTNGSLTAGAIMAHLDTRPMQAAVLMSTAQLITAVIASFGLMAFIGYRRLRRVVLTPLAAIETAVTTHDESNDELWRPAETDNELVGLARLLRESILARESSETAMRLNERMASVGTLAGGIAHEINTPLQFVSDGVHFLREASEEVIVAIAHVHAETQTVTEASSEDDLRRVVTAISDLVDDIDVDYLAERVPAAATRSADGVERVQSIVQSLKACADQTPRDMEADDLNRAVRNAITVVESECRRVARLTMEFGDLPPVVCHTGDIYQVLIHILTNAVDALRDRHASTARLGQITVRTAVDGAHALISVEDTGGGIPENVGPHVFDPFFTTKEVGKGSGQGLSVSWSLITERHGGCLWFDTTPGVGTTFYVRIPIAGRHAIQQLEAAA